MTSTRVGRSVAVLGVFLVCAQRIEAQSCLGLPNLSLMNRSLTAYASGQGGDRLVLGRYGLAGEKTFGGIQAGYGSGRGFNHPGSLAIGGDIGIAVPLGSSKTTFCPQVQSIYELSERRFGIQEHRLSSSAGVSIGRSVDFGQSFSIIPFAQVRLAHKFFGYDGRNNDSRVGIQSWDGLGSEWGAGFGLRFGETFTIRPSLVVPMDNRTGTREPVFGMSASFSIGRKR